MHLLVIGILVSQLLKLPQMYTSFPPLSHLNTMGIDRRAAAEDMGERGGGREGGRGAFGLFSLKRRYEEKHHTFWHSTEDRARHTGPRRARTPRRLKVAHAHRLRSA